MSKLPRLLGAGAIILFLCAADDKPADDQPADGPPTLETDCYDVAGDVVACRGDFPGGGAAANADVTIFDQNYDQLGKGRTDQNGLYLFKAPPVPFTVVISKGPGYLSSLQSNAITDKPQRPGWGGGLLPAATIDRLRKLKDWQDQFLGDRPPEARSAGE